MLGWGLFALHAWSTKSSSRMCCYFCATSKYGCGCQVLPTKCSLPVVRLLCCSYAPDAAVSSAEYYGAARAALDGLSTYARAVAPALPPSLAAVPDVANLGESVNAFMAASHDVPVTVCPVNCLNMGSFYGAHEGNHVA